MRHAFSFLIWDLRCAWHMRVGFECFLMTMQKDSAVPRFHNLEGEGNKPNHFPPTSETTPITLLQKCRQGLGRGRKSATGVAWDMAGTYCVLASSGENALSPAGVRHMILVNFCLPLEFIIKGLEADTSPL